MKRATAGLLVALAMLPMLTILANPARGADELVAEVRQRLTAAAVYRGNFEQRRELTGIARPLVSTGQFLLSNAHGLMWLVRAPLVADYKFVLAGVFQRLHGGNWQVAAGSEGPAERYLKIMLSVMSGDLPALQRDFEITSTGTIASWTLTLRPRSSMLARALDVISVRGGDWIDAVVIQEQAGSRTTIRLDLQSSAAALADAEVREFAP